MIRHLLKHKISFRCDFFDITLKFSDEANSPKVSSPNIQYKELDKSVDWQEVLLQKQMKRVAKGLWVSLLKLFNGTNQISL